MQNLKIIIFSLDVAPRRNKSSKDASEDIQATRRHYGTRNNTTKIMMNHKNKVSDKDALDC